MNNSIISYNNLDDNENVEPLKEKQGEMSRVIEAINRVEASQDWKNLKRLFLDDIVANLERQLDSEANRKELNAPEIYRLQGQLLWARRYVDLKKLAELFKLQVNNLKKQIYDKENPRDGAL